MFSKNKAIIIFKTIFIILLSFSLISCTLATHKNKFFSVPTHRLQWWLSDINWDSKRCEYSGKNIKIAIIDSGINSKHKDLKYCIEKEIKVSALKSSNSNNNEHGTEIAGIIAAYPHNDNGILGIATDAKVISIDITDSVNGDINEKDLIEGINIAIKEKADIINLSLGLSKNSAELERVITTAVDSGIFIVAASGNTNSELYPAVYDNVFSIDSYDRKGHFIYQKEHTNSVYLPGKNIVTSSKNDYSSVDGTSYSCAIFTGILALILEKNPNISYKQILKKTKGKKIDVNKILKGI